VQELDRQGEVEIAFSERASAELRKRRRHYGVFKIVFEAGGGS
jgi:hypothetical protein